MWRPLNWDNIIRDKCYDGHVVYREIDTFEVGASAMLKALVQHLKDNSTKSESIVLYSKDKQYTIPIKVLDEFGNWPEEANR